MTTPTNTAAASGAATIMRFNNLVGLMNPDRRGLYVRYEDHVAALAAAPAQPVEVPDGWRLVPIDLDDEIAEAIAKTARCCGGGAYDIWRAALMAVPQLPTQALDALKKAGAIAVSAAKTNSRDIADWREDMDRIAAIAAQQGAKP